MSKLELAGKNILVFGLGITGVETAKFLLQNNARVTVTDQASPQVLADNVAELKGGGIRLELGQHRQASVKQADLIVVSPGVPHTIAPLQQARSLGIPVIGEVELAARHIDVPILAVTGTNGKTTTTTLLGQMLHHSGFKVFVGGNIGTPLISYINQKQKADLVIAEISSFQLDTIVCFRPCIGVLLNIAADHLDRHGAFRAYVDSKFRLFENQLPDDVAVLNGADPLIRQNSSRIRGKTILFNSGAENGAGVIINGKRIRLRLPADGTGRHMCADPLVLDLSATHIIGRHNFENAAAAAAAALVAGGTLAGIQKTLQEFRGLAHRLEYVANIEGVRYFNDSKATNISAVASALRSFDQPLILILGGQNKGGDFRLLRNLIRKQTKQMISMGEAAPEIEAILGDVCPNRFKHVASMEEAVMTARRMAVADDVVLLSPGCASFDMYTNYAQRGDVFRNAVKRLQKKPIT